MLNTKYELSEKSSNLLKMLERAERKKKKKGRDERHSIK